MASSVGYRIHQNDCGPIFCVSDGPTDALVDGSQAHASIIIPRRRGLDVAAGITNAIDIVIPGPIRRHKLDFFLQQRIGPIGKGQSDHNDASTQVIRKIDPLREFPSDDRQQQGPTGRFCCRSGVSSQCGFYLGCFLWFANDRYL